MINIKNHSLIIKHPVAIDKQDLLVNHSTTMRRSSSESANFVNHGSGFNIDSLVA